MTTDPVVTESIEIPAEPSGQEAAPEARERAAHRREGERRTGQREATAPDNDRPRPDLGRLANMVASTIELPRQAAAEAEARMERARRRSRRVVSVLGAGFLLFILVCFVLVAAMLGGLPSSASPSSCGGVVGGVPVNLGAPGQLGGLAGTGITDAEYAAVKRSRHASARITPGEYVSTSYGPPWGGIQGEGNSTSGGLVLNKGAPPKYFVAVDPGLIGHANWIYIWPNPFEWRGPFLTADTGGAIRERRIDFYDWRGRPTQYGWGRRVVQVSASPLVATGGAAGTAPSSPPPVSAIGGSDPSVATGTSCGGAPLGAPGWGTSGGEAVIAPGADRSDKPTQPVLVDYVRATSAVAGRRIIITTGTNHSMNTTSGNVSDHYYGLAADIGSVANKFEDGGPDGTRIAAGALVVAGVPPETATAIAARGGVHNVCATAPDGRVWRVQVLWRTHKGGNHFNHVHIGLRAGCSYKGVVSS